MNRILIFLIALAPVLAAQGWPPVPAFAFEMHPPGQDDADYQRGLSELDAHQWDEAIASFAAAARRKAAADAALYWKAYAQNRSGGREEALATIRNLRANFPASRWLKDSRALELEIQSQLGSTVSPGAQPDDDLKLMAVNSLLRSEPGQALPLVQKLLAGNNPEKVKEQALFVLTQDSSPGAGKLLDSIAKGSSNPDLQLKAIRYMGMMGNTDARSALAALYRSSSDARVKRAILQSFMLSGSRDFLFNAAKTDQNPELRRDAIRQLALIGGQDQLWQLYQSDNSLENRRAILQSMFLSGNSSRLSEVALHETNPELRAAAIRSLGLMGDRGQGATLVSIYSSDKDPHVRTAILNSLFIQQNAKALIDLARQEKDPQLKKEIVQKLSLIHSKEATDYMLELLK